MKNLISRLFLAALALGPSGLTMAGFLDAVKGDISAVADRSNKLCAHYAHLERLAPCKEVEQASQLTCLQKLTADLSAAYIDQALGGQAAPQALVEEVSRIEKSLFGGLELTQLWTEATDQSAPIMVVGCGHANVGLGGPKVDTGDHRHAGHFTVNLSRAMDATRLQKAREEGYDVEDEPLDMKPDLGADFLNPKTWAFLPKNYFDIIYFEMPLEAVMSSLPAIQACHAMIRPGGKLVLDGFDVYTLIGVVGLPEGMPGSPTQPLRLEQPNPETAPLDLQFSVGVSNFRQPNLTHTAGRLRSEVYKTVLAGLGFEGFSYESTTHNPYNFRQTPHSLFTAQKPHS